MDLFLNGAVKRVKELKIALMDSLENSSSLKIGKWVRADLLLKGDIYHKKDGDWILVVEFIDED